ncbi:MAG: diaminopimelate decarboxylase [Rhodospirillaceae bacterium TMED8]|nr:diaminopimelate decarboxylase [Magnetovibrio sp.]OUT49878.1 MAG: diaminopimelate decarboxylase [Rhodospirillaceae bacterium TMED8]|tara:strand:+ start:4579 stop:5877 length:1299 start_codon:yes stop_codon:yes gene_type:complete
MDYFNYHKGELHAEGVQLSALADVIGTPFYCYSSAALVHYFKVFADAVSALDATICFAIKANSNIAVLATLERLGAGADVVSQGEMQRALEAGIDPKKIIFSGVGKSRQELQAALVAGVTRFNVESLSELEVLSAVADTHGQMAEVSLRVNPDVDARTHEKIATGRQEDKFGIDLSLARGAYRRARALPGIDVSGVAMHIGSQLTELDPFRIAYSRMADFVGVLREDGHTIRHLDLGGGLGITYKDEKVPTPEAYGAMVAETIGGLGCKLTFEPGRVIAGNAGILLTRVNFMKEGTAKTFCIVDAAMNDLIRPTLYNAHHDIVRVAEAMDHESLKVMDIVGPICESGDYIAKNRGMPSVTSGDLLAIRSAGAYGAVMSSTYNTRPLIPEVLVEGDEYAVIRRRFEVADMLALERLPPWLSGSRISAANVVGK